MHTLRAMSVARNNKFAARLLGSRVEVLAHKTALSPQLANEEAFPPIDGARDYLVTSVIGSKQQKKSANKFGTPQIKIAPVASAIPL